MKRRDLYIALMVLSVMFMAFPETVIHPFANKSPIQLNVYAWVHLVHLQLIAQIMMSVYDSHPDEKIDNKLYLVFMMYDWIDFTLTCNQPYSHIWNVPVTANILSLIGFICMTAAYRIWRTRFKL